MQGLIKATTFADQLLENWVNILILTLSLSHSLSLSLSLSLCLSLSISLSLSLSLSIRDCQRLEINDSSETFARARRFRGRFANDHADVSNRVAKSFEPERRSKSSPNSLVCSEISLTMSKSKRESIHFQKKNEDIFPPNRQSCNM